MIMFCLSDNSILGGGCVLFGQLVFDKQGGDGYINGREDRAAATG